MELSRLLKGKTVFIDTAPLIFFIEKHVRYNAIVTEAGKGNQDRCS